MEKKRKISPRVKVTNPRVRPNCDFQHIRTPHKEVFLKKYFFSYLHSLAKTADIACALDCMALMVSLLLPPAAAQSIEEEDEDLAPFPRPEVVTEALDSATGLDCSMMVHSASCTSPSSRSQKLTGSLK